jgi:hypothetical protein
MTNRNYPTIICTLVLFVISAHTATASTGDPKPRTTITAMAAAHLVGDTTPTAATATPATTTQASGEVKAATDVIKEVPKARSHPKPIAVTTAPVIKTTTVVPKVIKPIIRIH